MHITNCCNFLGRLVRDPELKTGRKEDWCHFTIAVNRPFSKEKEADFIAVKAFGKTAEFICEWFTKGQPIAIGCSYRIDEVEDEDSEENKKYHYFVADSVAFAGDAPNGDGGGSKKKKKKSRDEDDDEDEAPKKKKKKKQREEEEEDDEPPKKKKKGKKKKKVEKPWENCDEDCDNCKYFDECPE